MVKPNAACTQAKLPYLPHRQQQPHAQRGHMVTWPHAAQRIAAGDERCSSGALSGALVCGGALMGLLALDY